VYVCAFVFLYLCICDELITRPRSPTDSLRSRKPKWKGEFHGRRPRPKLGLLRRRKKCILLRSTILIWCSNS
jgi:hypothetical protein